LYRDQCTDLILHSLFCRILSELQPLGIITRMPTVQLYVDTRENSLAKLLGELRPDDERILYRTLRTGDFKFKIDGRNVCKIERKRVDDFVSSVIDGRFRKQRSAMLERRGNANYSLVFLLEGNLQYFQEFETGSLENPKLKLFTVRYLKNLLEDLPHDYGISVVYTEEIFDTIRYLGRRLNRYTERGDPRETLRKLNVLDTMDIGRKLGLNQKTWTAASLSLIRGITKSAATAVSEKYPSMEALRKHFKATPSSHLSLEDIQVDGKALGCHRSVNIYNYVMDEEMKIEKVKRPKVKRAKVKRESVKIEKVKRERSPVRRKVPPKKRKAVKAEY